MGKRARPIYERDQEKIMKGTIHEVYIDSKRGKGVGLCNQQDPYYDCLFETEVEIDSFIEELCRARDKVFE